LDASAISVARRASRGSRVCCAAFIMARYGFCQLPLPNSISAFISWYSSSLVSATFGSGSVAAAGAGALSSWSGASARGTATGSGAAAAAGGAACCSGAAHADSRPARVTMAKAFFKAIPMTRMNPDSTPNLSVACTYAPGMSTNLAN
jgi:hypothetical protein